MFDKLLRSSVLIISNKYSRVRSVKEYCTNKLLLKSPSFSVLIIISLQRYMMNSTFAAGSFTTRRLNTCITAGQMNLLTRRHLATCIYEADWNRSELNGTLEAADHQPAGPGALSYPACPVFASIHRQTRRIYRGSINLRFATEYPRMETQEAVYTGLWRNWGR